MLTRRQVTFVPIKSGKPTGESLRRDGIPAFLVEELPDKAAEKSGDVNGSS